MSDHIPMLKTVIAGVIGPLIVAGVLGYTALFPTMTRLTMLADHSEKRLSVIENDFKRHTNEYRDLQVMLAKQTQVLEFIYQDYKSRYSLAQREDR